MDIYVFCNSTGISTFEKGSDEVPTLVYGPSYKDMLEDKYGYIEGYWQNGLLLLSVREMIRKIVKGTTMGLVPVVIINVGVCESVTRSPINFLHMANTQLNSFGYDNWFGTFIAPKMTYVSTNLVHGREKHIQFLEIDEFALLFSQIFDVLQGDGTEIICIGLNKPIGTKEELRRREQTYFYNIAISDVCSKYEQVSFINVWDICDGEVVDSTHMTSVGHRLVFDEIEKVIGSLPQ